MANIISNNNNNSGGAVGNNAGGGSVYNNNNNNLVAAGNPNICTLRDVCNFLQAPLIQLPPGACPYDHIIEMMRGLDLQDDGIIMNHKIKTIETDFCNIVQDEDMLSESMHYINDKALADGDTALKFALLFSSRNFDALAMKDTKVRSAMLKILEMNFIDAEVYRIQDRDRLYNSITLLGEYYHRVRLADNSPINVLGESLLGLLIREVSEFDCIDAKLAKLILSQVTLNGDIMRIRHKKELTQLLFHLRRNLIEQPALTPTCKALLLMTIDLYYSNFKNLGEHLEEMYTKYLIHEANEDNNTVQQSPLQQQPHNMYQILPQQQQQQQQTLLQNQSQNYAQQEPNKACNVATTVANNSFENGENENAAGNDSYEIEPSTKKWSEQVCEDSFYEKQFELKVAVEPHDDANSEQIVQSKSRNNNGNDNTHKNSRRSYQSRISPKSRAQRHNYKSNEG